MAKASRWDQLDSISRDHGSMSVCGVHAHQPEAGDGLIVDGVRTDEFAEHLGS